MKTIYLILFILFSSIPSFSQDSTETKKSYEIIFQNWAGRDIEVAIKYFPINGKNWEITGWLSLVAGEERTIVFTERSHFYYHAKFVRGIGSWSGGYYNKIENKKVGMRLVDIEKTNSIKDSIYILRLE